MILWLCVLAVPIALWALYYVIVWQPHSYGIARKLARAQYEHAEWIARCLEWTEEGWDAEAKFAAEQVKALREEINRYRRMLERLQRPRTEKV